MMQSDEGFREIDGDELQEIEFGASPMHTNSGNTKKGVIEMRPMFSYSKSYSQVQSGGDTGDEEKAGPSFPRVIVNTVTQLNRKRPRAFTSILLGCFVILPLIIAVIVLASRPPTESSVSESSSGSTRFSQNALKSSNGVVTADHATCTQVGASMLNRGGNAVDAAIATAFCNGVVSPGSSGIGGGCYILIFNETSGDSHFIDAREVAPQSAHPTMFVSDPMKAQDGGLAVAVLGEVAGLYAAYQQFGSQTIPWAELIEPAATLAEKWTLSPYVALILKEIEPQLLSGKYPLLSALYLTPQNTLKQAGATIEQPQLAHTLRQIGQQGPSYLYETMAETLAAEINTAGGNYTAADIKNYRPFLTTPLRTPLLPGIDYLGVGSSSSGGAVVAGILKFMFSFGAPVVYKGQHYFHRLAEALKHTFAIRLSLGDPFYVNTTAPFQALLSDEYMQSLAEMTIDDNVLPMGAYGGQFNVSYSQKDDHGTSHISVLDRQGLAVSMTTTINTYFGSKVVSPSTGILFNNQMDDFSVPGAENYFHLAPSPYNYPEPGKKPLSSMSPSMLIRTSQFSSSSSSDQKKKERLVLIGGASGGPRIITATAQVILNYLGLGMDLLSAVVAPRLHSQLIPETLDVEDQFLVTSQQHITMPVSVYNYLKEEVHQPGVQWHDGSFAVTQFIAIDEDTGERTAVCDPRKGGIPAAEQEDPQR